MTPIPLESLMNPATPPEALGLINQVMQSLFDSLVGRGMGESEAIKYIQDISIDVLRKAGEGSKL